MTSVTRNFGLTRLKNIGKYVRNAYPPPSPPRPRGKKKPANFARGNSSDYPNMSVGRRSTNLHPPG